MAEGTYTYGKISYYDRYTSTSNLAYDNALVEEESKITVHKRKKESLLDQPKKLLFIAATLIIIGFFVIIWRSAIISSMNSQVVGMKHDLNVIYSQNEQTSVMLDRTTDLSYVENVAKNKLDMDVPKAEQKVYIDVDVQDMVEIPVKESKSLFSGAKKFVSGCLEYLY